MIRAVVQKISLPPYNHFADFLNGPPPLLNIFQKLRRCREPFFDVRTYFPIRRIANQHPPVTGSDGVVARLRLPSRPPFTLFFYESYVGRYQARLALVVPQSGAWIEMFNHVHGASYQLHRAIQRSRNGRQLIALEQLQMVAYNLSGQGVLWRQHV